MIQIKLTLPKKISLNKIYAGAHWAIRKAEKDLYRKAVLALKIKEKVKGRVDITMEFYFKGRGLDSSNTSYMAKLIEDSIVKSGIMIDDSPKYVRWFNLVSKKTKDKDYVIVTIKEIKE